jgi:putative nucleotidyltransferase with HDIG domain
MTPERSNHPQLDNEIENFALQFLAKGRKGWDEPHTRAVVYHAGEIAKAKNLDILVLNTTAWLHDIGYFAMFENSNSDNYDDVKAKKEAHMINGARLAKEFLERPEISKYYTEEQKKKIIHLVSVHDKIEELVTDEEIAFMEADTLGAIDVSRVTPTFDKEGAEKYIKGLMSRRVPKFRTDLGKKTFAELIGPFKAHFGI